MSNNDNVADNSVPSDESNTERVTAPNGDAVRHGHTVGPWTYDSYRQALTTPCRTGGLEVLAAVYRVDGDRLEANARLIAAAPDLLAALEACERHLDLSECCRGARDVARAAIAKARETPQERVPARDPVVETRKTLEGVTDRQRASWKRPGGGR